MIDHILAKPCGSKIRNKTINAPNIIKLKCSTVAALIGTPNILGRFVIRIGIRTINAAPKNAPEMLPKPPMIIMNKISNEETFTSISPVIKSLFIVSADLLTTSPDTQTTDSGFIFSTILKKLLLFSITH